MEQVIISGFYDPLNITSTEYNRISGAKGNWGTVVSRQQLIATGGILKNLRVELNDVPGTGTYVFSLYRGVGIGAPAVTALTCTVAADGTTASDTVNEVAVAAGDVISLECNPDAPDNARYAKWSMVFEGDTANESLLLGNTGANENLTVYCSPVGGASETTENDVRCVCPTGGIIKNLYVWLSADPGNDPDAYRFTLRIGGVSQTLTCTITADGRVGSDVAHPIAVSAGDVLTLMIEPLEGPTTSSYVAFGMTFVATIDGESLMLGGSRDDMHSATTEYNYLMPTEALAWTATEAERYQLAQVCVLKKLYVLLSGSPGNGNNYVFTVRKNAAAPASGLVVTIVDLNTTGNDTGNTIAVIDDDELDMETNPDSNPTSRDAYWGLVCYIEPPAPPPPPPTTVKTPFSVDTKPRTRMKFHPSLRLG